MLALVIIGCLLLVSVIVSFATLAGVMTPPGWAFKQAHRGSKLMWVLIALIGLVPPLGLISSVMWIACGYAVGRAWKRGNPATYGQYQHAREETLRQQQQLELNRQQQEMSRRNRSW
jgi:hypothetical protein